MLTLPTLITVLARTLETHCTAQYRTLTLPKCSNLNDSFLFFLFLSGKYRMTHSDTGSDDTELDDVVSDDTGSYDVGSDDVVCCESFVSRRFVSSCTVSSCFVLYSPGGRETGFVVYFQ